MFFLFPNESHVTTFKANKGNPGEPLIENGGGVETHKRKTGIYFIAGNLFI